MSKPEMTDFLRGYIMAALWSSADNSDDTLDKNYDETDIHSATLSQMARDCRDFVKANRELLAATRSDDCRHGVDFWLSRNGHGAGFWDRGYREVGDKLHAAAKVYSGVDLYVYRGRVYQHGAERPRRKAA